jgi:hypothetical protein
MSLLGRAFLAFSHDVTPGGEPDWTEWHDREHIPERLSIPGFLRLRRYVALGAGPRFFYFYETESLDVLQSPAYLERLSNPTPWTKRCIQYVVNNKRTACRVAASLGHALGGVIAVVMGLPGRADALRRWLVDTALPVRSPCRASSARTWAGRCRRHDGEPTRRAAPDARGDGSMVVMLEASIDMLLVLSDTALVAAAPTGDRPKKFPASGP